jgi:hypothetical protein
VYDVNLCVNTSVVEWFLSLKVAVLHFKQTRRATKQFPHLFCKLTSLSPGKLGKLTSLWPIVEGPNPRSNFPIASFDYFLPSHRFRRRDLIVASETKPLLKRFLWTNPEVN